MRARLLLVAAYQELIDHLTRMLVAEDAEVEVAQSAASGLALASSGGFDLILLDSQLPDRSGLAVCAELRRQGIDTSLVLMTEERVRGLRLGADDCVSRSCDLGELLARLEALARRIPKPATGSAIRFSFDDVVVDFALAEARKGGIPVSLTGKELSLLRYLVDHRNRVVSRQEILRNVWEYDAAVSSRTIDVHVGWLRQKLEDDPQQPRYIKTIRGRGYRFDSEDSSYQYPCPPAA
jgi:two-component system alkaline phosphatase synthesis response regulator PhoP